MKFLSWNIRGLNGAHKQDIIRNMIRDQRPDFLFLQETKTRKEILEQISFNKSMRGVAASSDGASGGPPNFVQSQNLQG